MSSHCMWGRLVPWLWTLKISGGWVVMNLPSCIICWQALAFALKNISLQALPLLMMSETLQIDRRKEVMQLIQMHLCLYILLPLIKLFWKLREIIERGWRIQDRATASSPIGVKSHVAYLMPNHTLVLADLLLLGRAWAVLALPLDYLFSKIFETYEIDGRSDGFHCEHAHNHGFLALLETLNSH